MGVLTQKGHEDDAKIFRISIATDQVQLSLHWLDNTSPNPTSEIEWLSEKESDQVVLVNEFSL